MPLARQFKLHGLLGKGGFGVVYRATLKSDAFQTEVALKLLHADDIPPSVIARFKDEATVLGLIRDSAVVRVYPPAELDGRPALVMEYVDGESTARLLKRLRGPLPPRVATAIIAEVARSLHDVYEQRGPDERPLHLVHRDLKPGNIQLTPAGAVKVLDFGLAKASYDGREAQTTQHLFGTPHYMAPERLHGEDGPASDIFSLGVTWRRLMWGDVPIGGGRFKPNRASPPAASRMLEEAEVFIERMVAVEPDARPTAREVEERALDLAERMAGPTLRSWARENVEPWRGEDSTLTGSTFDESIVTTLAPSPAATDVEVPPPPPTRPGPVRWILPLFGLGALMMVSAVALLAIAWGLWNTGNPEPDVLPVQPLSAPAPPPAPVPDDPVPEPLPAPVPDPDPAPPAPAPDARPSDPGTRPSAPKPTTPPSPSPAPPGPEPVQASPVPEPSQPEPPLPSPEPVPAPPEPEPAPRPPRVVVEDDGVVVFFKGADGHRYSASELQPGTYTLEANFDPADPSALLELGEHTFLPGSTYFVRCVRTMNHCRVIR